MNFLRISEIKSIPEKEKGGPRFLLGHHWTATGLGLREEERQVGLFVGPNYREEREGQHWATGPML